MRFIPVATVSFLLTNNVQVIKALAGENVDVMFMKASALCELTPPNDDLQKKNSDGAEFLLRGGFALDHERDMIVEYWQNNMDELEYLSTLPGYNELLQSKVISPIDERSRPLIESIPNAVDDISLTRIRASINEAMAYRETHQLPQRFISHVEADPVLVAKLRGMAGTLPVADRDFLPTVTVEGASSVPHVDCFMSKDTNKVEKLMGPNDRVAFLVAETEGDVHFRHADVTVPLKVGSFIHFRADIPHYTVLGEQHGGKAKLLGPFHIDNPDPIGSMVEPLLDSQSVLLLELPSKVIPCYTTMIKKDGEFILVSGYIKMQFKISEGDGETRISSFTINGKDIGQGGVATLCQLAEFSPDMQCVKESMEHYADREEIAKMLWSILFDRCANDTAVGAMMKKVVFEAPEGAYYLYNPAGVDSFSPEYKTNNGGNVGYIDLSEGSGVEGAKAGKIGATDDRKRNRERGNRALGAILSDNFFDLVKVKEALACEPVDTRAVIDNDTWLFLRQVYQDTVGPMRSSITNAVKSSGSSNVIAADDSPLLSVSKFPGKGRGLIASKDIEEGELLWNDVYLAEFFHPRDLNRFLTALPHELVCEVLTWVFYHVDPTVAVSRHYKSTDTGGRSTPFLFTVNLDISSYCNDGGSDSDETNTKMVQGTPVNSFYASKQIKAGEEILCDYSSKFKVSLKT